MDLPKMPSRLLALQLLVAAAALPSCSKHHAAAQPQMPATPPQLVPPVSEVPTGPDLSTPKGVALAFANAAAAGDSAGMRKLATGTESHMFGYFAAFADLVSSQHIFVTALKTKFGDDCEIPPDLDRLGNLPSMPSNFDDLTEKIDNDTAVLIDPRGHAGVRLKKVDGNWKVDFAAEEAVLAPGSTDGMDGVREKLVAVKKSLDQVSAKVFDGAYADCKSATDAALVAIAPVK